MREGAGGREYVLDRAARSGEIVFTQQDVRALQLAKAAIATGWALLLQPLGIGAADLEHVYVAGAFGNYLDLDAAQELRSVPAGGPRACRLRRQRRRGRRPDGAHRRARAPAHGAPARRASGSWSWPPTSEFLAAFSDRLGF